jgi:hypothetical protein
MGNHLLKEDDDLIVSDEFVPATKNKEKKMCMATARTNEYQVVKSENEGNG